MAEEENIANCKLQIANRPLKDLGGMWVVECRYGLWDVGHRAPGKLRKKLEMAISEMAPSNLAELAGVGILAPRTNSGEFGYGTWGVGRKTPAAGRRTPDAASQCGTPDAGTPDAGARK